MAQDASEPLENTEKEEVVAKTTADILELDIHEDIEEETIEDHQEVDYQSLGKQELLAVLEKEANALKTEPITPARLKRVDEISKEIKPVLDGLKKAEWEEARQRYVADNGEADGFEYKYDTAFTKADELLKEIRSTRSGYYQTLEKNKDKNFTTKTALLQRLRDLVEGEEVRETDASDMKASWGEFKKIQEEWKEAGNISSPHNGTLWATYNALVDRYFSIRHIYFELKELDRKRNTELKAELCDKVEAIVKNLESTPMTRELLEEANHLFEDYKHIGPAPREDQEQLWQRFKKSLDVLYDARRAQQDDQKKTMADTYSAKSAIYEEVVPFTSFSSGSINDWNAKTKEILAFQEKWVATKGLMPREEGKELSKKFWAALKTFFFNKGEFFKQLESKRDQNLTQKTGLCEEVEKIVASEEDNAQNTQRVIELQKKWKSIGQVPEKFKDSIYLRFKNACDNYFNRKRSKNQEVEKEFEDNLAKKKELCNRIEKLSIENESSIAQLNSFKEEWSAIGFVPKKDMQNIQKRYIGAINGYVSAIGKLSSKEKEQVLLENEVQLVRDGDSGRGLFKKETDIRRKITQLESDISLWQNNIEFFAKSKASDKLKADFEKKIQSAEKQLQELKHQLSIIQEAI